MPFSLSQPFSRPRRAVSRARSAVDPELLDVVELPVEYLRLRLLLLLLASSRKTVFPAPPRPTWYTGAARRRWRSSSSSKLKMARSLLLWTFPAPPRPDMQVDGVRESSRVSEAGPDAVRESVVLVFLRLITLPEPPRPVKTTGRLLCGTEGCGSITR